MKATLIYFVAMLGLTSLPAFAQWRAEILSEVVGMDSMGGPIRVRFCPKDAEHALVTQNNEAFLIDAATGQRKSYRGKGSIVDWADHYLLVKDAERTFLVDVETWSPLVTTEGESTEAVAKAYEEVTTQRKPQLVGRGKDARVVRESDGEVLYRGPFFGGIYGFDTNQDYSMWLIFLGDADYLVYEPEGKKKTKLPTTPMKGDPNGFSAWHFGGSDYLIAEQNVVPQGIAAELDEESLEMETRLFYFDLATESLARIALPTALQGKSLEVLDAAKGGRLFVRARRSSGEVLGNWILALRQAS